MTGEQLVIRTFAASDQAEVVALWTTVFGDPQARNDPATVIRQKLAVQSELFFVACLHGKLVGTAMCGYDGHRGWIYTLAVAPAVRRRGIGTALVRRIETELAQRGCPKINLQVLESNAATTGFYEQLGYRVEPRISMGKVL